MMADDRLIVEGQLKFENQPFRPFENAVKKTSNFIKKLEGSTKKLQATSTQTSKKLNKMLDDYNNRGKKSQSVTGKLIKGIGGLAAAYIGVSKAFETVNLASEMTETQNKLNVVFGKMAGDANKWAEEYSNSMGFSVLKTKEGMGDIQNLFTGFGMARDTSFSLSKEIVQLANDLDSFNNLSAKGVNVQKTMISALMGETEAAKTLGASILETNLNTAAAEMGLGKYSAKMDEATKIQIRLHAIQMQSKDAMGDVARNLETEVGLRRRLNAQIENNKVAIGNKLMPVWMKLLKVGINVSNSISNNIDKFDGLGNALGTVFGIGSKFIEMMTGASFQARSLQLIVGTLTGAFLTYKAVALGVFLIEKARAGYKAAIEIPLFFKENLMIIKNTGLLVAQKLALAGGFVATKLFTAGQWALNIALNANPLGLVVAGLAILTGAFMIAYNKIEPFRQMIDKLWETVKKFGGKVFGINTTNTTENKTTGSVPQYANGTSNHPRGSSVTNNISIGNKLMPVWMKLLKTGTNVSNSITENIDKFDTFAKAISGVFDIGNKFVEMMTGASFKARALQVVVGALTGAFLTYKAVALGVFLIEKARAGYKAAVEIPLFFKENLMIIKNTGLLVAQKVALGASYVASKLFTAGQWALNLALNANPIGLVIAGVALLGGAFMLAYKKIEPFKNFIDSIWEKLKNSAFAKVVGKLMGGGESTVTSVNKTIPQYANGTSNHPGGMALVGEQGPELVNLPRGSSVTNNTTTSKMGGNSISVQGDSISINISGGGSPIDIWEQIKPKLDQYNRRKRERLIASLT